MKNKKEELADSDRWLLRPRRAFDLADVPRSTGYLLIKTGEWPSIRMGKGGKMIRIPVAALQRWLERKMEEAECLEVQSDKGGAQ